MMKLLKSKKVLMTVIGIATCCSLWYAGASTELLVSAAALFGISISGHIITDIVSMIKGLQEKK